MKRRHEFDSSYECSDETEVDFCELLDVMRICVNLEGTKQCLKNPIQVSEARMTQSKNF